MPDFTPIYQTKFGTDGNCTQACIATLLGIPLDHFPALPHDDTWLTILNDFLQTEGWMALALRPVDSESWPVGLTLITGGPGGRRGLGHYVIMEDDKLLHDPMPGGAGLAGEREDFLLLFPTQPWLWQRKMSMSPAPYDLGGRHA